MEKYRKVPPQKDSSAQTDDAVVRVQVQGKISHYVNYASGLLDDPTKGRVEIVGLGRAINKAVTVAEVLRRKFANIHQLTKLSSVTITDRYEPLEEGLDPLESERTVSCISVELVRGDGSSLDKSAPGYAAPLGEEDPGIVTDESLSAMDAADRAAAPRGRGRGRGRGGRGRGGFRRRGRGGARGGFSRGGEPLNHLSHPETNGDAIEAGSPDSNATASNTAAATAE